MDRWRYKGRGKMCKKKKHTEKKEEYPSKELKEAWEAIERWQDKNGTVSLSKIVLESKKDL